MSIIVAIALSAAAAPNPYQPLADGVKRLCKGSAACVGEQERAILNFMISGAMGGATEVEKVACRDQATKAKLTDWVLAWACLRATIAARR